jgi:hypothetical protein
MMINRKQQIEINKKFDTLCINGNLSKIDSFAKAYSGILTTEGDRDNELPLFYRLAINIQLEVIKYLFQTPYINEIPQNIFWDLDIYEDNSALSMLYKNKQVDFIKYLLTDKSLKDNVNINQVYKGESRLNIVDYSDFLELIISNKDWKFAEYLINEKDIKYPIEKSFSVVKHALRHTHNIDNEIINNFLELTTEFFKKEDSITIFECLASEELLNNLTLEMQIETVKKALSLNLFDSNEVIKEIDEKSKDEDWLASNQNTISLYKILLNHEMQKILPMTEKINKKHKV